ncbi:hypothetical protein [Sutcliffiella deserti]|uniref:hypothetical protein n=1 Tax=Sutcliffiella deserti TaxID=2875501 RepID=UPI001CBA7121|nr:hypothetical protein [Sutcliffiella deserti]
MMKDKLNHYDGSVHEDWDANNLQESQEAFVLTDDMRKSISGNPFELHKAE